LICDNHQSGKYCNAKLILNIDGKPAHQDKQLNTAKAILAAGNVDHATVLDPHRSPGLSGRFVVWQSPQPFCFDFK